MKYRFDVICNYKNEEISDRVGCNNMKNVYEVKSTYESLATINNKEVESVMVYDEQLQKLITLED